MGGAGHRKHDVEVKGGILWVERFKQGVRQRQGIGKGGGGVHQKPRMYEKA